MLFAMPRTQEARRDGRRAEARGTARERLLAAAARVFAERGYASASIDEIARDAGVTKGAVYWNFDSKEELFFALLDQRLDAGARRLMGLTAGAPADVDSAPEVSAGFSEIVDAGRDVVLLMHEHWSLAARDPRLGGAYAERQRALREGIARALEARHATTGIPLTVPAQRLATVILALSNGLAMDRLVDSDAVPDDLFGEALSLLYDGLVHRAGEAGS
jgi:AcrR family transcriptional regulator